MGLQAAINPHRVVSVLVKLPFTRMRSRPCFRRAAAVRDAPGVQLRPEGMPRAVARVGPLEHVTHLNARAPARAQQRAYLLWEARECSLNARVAAPKIRLDVNEYEASRLRPWLRFHRAVL